MPPQFCATGLSAAPGTGTPREREPNLSLSSWAPTGESRGGGICLPHPQSTDPYWSRRSSPQTADYKSSILSPLLRRGERKHKIARRTIVAASDDSASCRTNENLGC